jgi:hypothetical protein
MLSATVSDKIFSYMLTSSFDNTHQIHTIAKLRLIGGSQSFYVTDAVLDLIIWQWNIVIKIQRFSNIRFQVKQHLLA